MKVCSEHGCPTLTTTTRCGQHTRTKRAQRGTITEQGYGWQHQRERAAWKQRIGDSDTPTCRWCGKPITSADAWDLGHTDDRATWSGPEHSACNRAAGAQHWDHGIA